MPQENKSPIKKSASPDWFVRGVLTKFGEIFDRFTGRNWKPSSSVATSELIEKLKILLDAEAEDLPGKGRFVPHHIELKTQWDKFSTEADVSLKKLENELLVAAVDHINDRRYHTFAPLQLEIKPDYFTEGVKLSASFDTFAPGWDEDEAEVNLTVSDLKNVIITAPEEIEPEKEIFVFTFRIQNRTRQVELFFVPKQRMSVGRTKESDLWLEDTSVSKAHAALVLNEENQLMVADTGSTNGTFINGQRIAYGRAFLLNSGDNLRFGTIEVAFVHRIIEAEIVEDNLTVEHNQSENDDAIKAEHFTTKDDILPSEQTGVLNFNENK